LTLLSGGVLVWLCLERGAELHAAQLMPLPLTVSCFSKIQIDFTFLHRESKKTRHQTLSHSFNYYPIFKIFSLKDSVVNLQQTLKIPPRLKHVATLPCEI